MKDTLITKLVTAICIIFLPLMAKATLIKGKITDAEGFPISFASIIVKDTRIGTSAAEDGSYFINVPEGNATIQVRAISYQSVSKSVLVQGASMELDFTLKDEGGTLAEFVVKASAEDPAYPIMRKVIANKKVNSRKLQSLQTDIYLKGKMYLKSIPNKVMGQVIDDSTKLEMRKSLGLDTNSSGIIFLLEQFTKYYYQAPNKELNRVMAVKTSGDPRGLGFATMPAIVDIYSNNIDLMKELNPRGFISPAHDNAFNYYQYKYLGSFTEDGIEIDKISFWPKRGMEPTFRGTLYIAESEWAFQQVDLILDKKAQIQVVDTFRLQQQYTRTKEKNWIIQQQIIYPWINFFGFEIAGDILTNYNDIQVNKKIPDSVFRNKIISVYDSNALDRQSGFWTEARPVALSTEEHKNYHFKDSSYIVETAKVDSFYNASKQHFGFRSLLIDGAFYQKRNNKVGLRPLLSSVGFNTVEGFVLGVKPYWEHKTKGKDELNISWNNYYGFANRQYQSMLQASYLDRDPKLVGRSSKYWLMIGKEAQDINYHEPLARIINAWTSLMERRNYLKLYQAYRASLGYEHIFGNGFSIAGNLKFEDRSEMRNHTNFSFSKKNSNVYTDNKAEGLPTFEDHRAAIFSLGVTYQPGWQKILYPKYSAAKPSAAPIFSLQYDKGFKGILGSKTNFDRWKINIQHQLGLKLLGALSYRLEAGGFSNKKYVGLPDMYALLGNQTRIANTYMQSFQTAPYYLYGAVPNYYGEAHLAWHLNGFLTNKIPGFKHLHWQLVLSGNGMYRDSGDYYTEYGFGLENIGYKMFRFLRVDYFIGKGSLENNWQHGLRIGSSIPLEQLGL